jgi:DNA-binding response OmpR family regulator
LALTALLAGAVRAFASTAKEAAEAASRVKPQFLAARRICSDADNLHARTPIVAQTASVAPEDIRHDRDSGMDAVRAKPIRLETLRQALARVLRSAAPAFTPATEALSVGGIDRRLLETHASVFGQARLEPDLSAAAVFAAGAEAG